MFPAVVSPPSSLSSIQDAIDWAATERNNLLATLDSSGAVLFRNFPVTSAEDFDGFSAAFGFRDFTYAESLSNAVRINLTPRVFTANEAPPDVEIFLHHEMAQTPVYPHKLFFYCHRAAEQGGATPVCRSDLLYRDLLEQDPVWAEAFETRGLRYRTHMPADNKVESGQGRSWKSTLSAATPGEAEARLNTLGYTWEWQSDNSLMTWTPVLPAVRQLDDGSQSFFNQVLAASLGWKRSAGNPEPVVTFGDGTPIPDQVIETLRQLADRHTVPLEWQDGDVALVDNFRVMHGRYPFSGKRKRQVLVCLAMAGLVKNSDATA